METCQGTCSLHYVFANGPRPLDHWTKSSREWQKSAKSIASMLQEVQEEREAKIREALEKAKEEARLLKRAKLRHHIIPTPGSHSPSPPCPTLTRPGGVGGEEAGTAGPRLSPLQPLETTRRSGEADSSYAEEESASQLSNSIDAIERSPTSNMEAESTANGQGQAGDDSC